MSYKKDIDAINEFMAMAEFRQSVRVAAHNGNIDAVVANGDRDFMIIVRCAQQDMETVKRRISNVKRAKVDQLTDSMLGVNVE